jgi:hypothetical protein
VHVESIFCGPSLGEHLDARQRGKEASRPPKSEQAFSLTLLTAEFDALLDRMQTPEARAAMRDAFSTSPDELGRAALAARQNPEQ